MSPPRVLTHYVPGVATAPAGAASPAGRSMVGGPAPQVVQPAAREVSLRGAASPTGRALGGTPAPYLVTPPPQRYLDITPGRGSCGCDGTGGRDARIPLDLRPPPLFWPTNPPAAPLPFDPIPLPPARVESCPPEWRTTTWVRLTEIQVACFQRCIDIANMSVTSFDRERPPMVDTYGQAGTWARDRNDLWLDTFLAAISGYGDLIPECGQLASAPYIWDLIAATSGDSPVITVRLPFEDMFVLPVFGARGNEIPSTYRVNACMWPGRPDWYIDDRIRPGGIIPENELL